MSDYDNCDSIVVSSASSSSDGEEEEDDDGDLEEDLEDDSVLLALEPNQNSIIQEGMDLEDDYPYKVLSTDDIMMCMIETIKEVTNIVLVKVENSLTKF